MPRVARKKSRSGIYHIIMRGINRQSIFEDDEDRYRFLETLRKYKEVSRYQIYSYCLMENHIHLLLKEAEEEESLSTAMKRISSSYVYWYNTKYERSGHLFQERFKSENVEDRGYFFTVLRYIHQNPLKAGLVTDVFQSEWTSVHEYISKGKIVDIDFGLDLISSNRKEAVKLYTEYMRQHNDDQCLDITVRSRKSDQEVRKMLHQLGISSKSELQQMTKDNRDAILAHLKTIEGISIRQLSRITGVSKSVVERA